MASVYPAYNNLYPEIGTPSLGGSTVKVGSEYDASPQRKRNAEIEIESIHAFGHCARLHHIVN